jgi:hypothetical protein
MPACAGVHAAAKVSAAAAAKRLSLLITFPSGTGSSSSFAAGRFDQAGLHRMLRSGQAAGLSEW